MTELFKTVNNRISSQSLKCGLLLRMIIFCKF